MVRDYRKSVRLNCPVFFFHNVSSIAIVHRAEMYVSLHLVFTRVDNHNNCVHGDASQWSLKYAEQCAMCMCIDLNVHIALCMIPPPQPKHNSITPLTGWSQIVAGVGPKLDQTRPGDLLFWHLYLAPVPAL